MTSNGSSAEYLSLFPLKINGTVGYSMFGEFVVPVNSAGTTINRDSIWIDSSNTYLRMNGAKFHVGKGNSYLTIVVPWRSNAEAGVYSPYYAPLVFNIVIGHDRIWHYHVSLQCLSYDPVCTGIDKDTPYSLQQKSFVTDVVTLKQGSGNDVNYFYAETSGWYR